MGDQHQHVLAGVAAVGEGDPARRDLAGQTGRGQVVQLAQIRAAVPAAHQLQKLGRGEIVPAIAASELLNVKPRLEAADKAIERAREKLFSEHRIVHGLLRRGHHVGGADRDVVAGITGPVHLRHDEDLRIVVGFAVDRVRSLADKSKDAVRGRAGHGAAQDLLKVVPVLGRKAYAVVAGREGDRQQLVAKALHGVTKAGVGDRVFVQLQLVQVDELAVEGVKQVRFERQRFQVDAAAPDLALNNVAQAAVGQLQRHARWVALSDQAQPGEVVDQKVEALHALLERAGHGLSLGAAEPVPDRQHRLQRLQRHRLGAFPGAKGVRLGKAPQRAVRMIKAAHVVDKKQVPGHQLQGRAAQRSAVQGLALRKRKQVGDRLDAPFRQGGGEIPSAAVQIVQKPTAGKPLQILDPVVVGHVPRPAQHAGQVGRFSHSRPCPDRTRPPGRLHKTPCARPGPPAAG